MIVWSPLVRRFRPLAGIMVLIFHDGQRRSPAPEEGVSVPLRGLWFLSTIIKLATELKAERVSVPLRGLWFLSGKWERLYCPIS